MRRRSDQRGYDSLVHIICGTWRSTEPKSTPRDRDGGHTAEANEFVHVLAGHLLT